MDIQRIIRRAGIPLPFVCELMGGKIGLSYMKHLSSGARRANEKHRAAISRAFREHAKTLVALADELDAAE